MTCCCPRTVQRADVQNTVPGSYRADNGVLFAGSQQVCFLLLCLESTLTWSQLVGTLLGQPPASSVTVEPQVFFVTKINPDLIMPIVY